MSHKHVAIVLGTFAILTLSVSTATIFGLQDTRAIFTKKLASVFFTNANPVTLKDCDPSATTSPCVIDDSATPPLVAEQSDTPPVLTYGALSKTYVNDSQHFTFAYPSEMSIESAGDILLHDTRNARNFALKICARGTPCAADYKYDESPSIDDFRSVRLAPYGSSTLYGGLVYRYAPQETEVYTTSRGYSVLKLQESHSVVDESGRDVTNAVCEECGTARKYVLFSPSGDYVVLWLISGRADVAEQIIDTIRF